MNCTTEFNGTGELYFVGFVPVGGVLKFGTLRHCESAYYPMLCKPHIASDRKLI
jgi:hypothetical protein